MNDAPAAGPPNLETARLRLRPFTLADAGDVRRLAGERAVAEMTINLPHPYPEGAAEAWIASRPGTFASGKGMTWAITRRETGELIGAISLMDIAAGHQAEMGYWIGVPWWGRGYCTEAAAAAVAHAFTALGLERVHAHCFTRNPASARVLRKAGLSFEGRLRQHARRDDRLEDIDFYGVLRPEWEAAEAVRSRASDGEPGGASGPAPAPAPSTLSAMITGQYRAAWSMLRDAVERFPDAEWRTGEVELLVPARVACHVVETADYYFRAPGEAFAFGGRFGVDWETGDRASLPDQDQVLAYLEAVWRKGEAWLSLPSELLLEPDPVYGDEGMTRIDRLLYLLRHTHHHVGELCTELRRRGIARPAWR